MNKINILVIIIDSLRPDHLRKYGYFRDTSPNIDKFAEEGTSFLNTYSTLPRSEGSITSMLTGLYPHSHGVRLVWDNKRNQSVTSLPEILQNHGYSTCFIRSGGLAYDEFGKGFKDYDLLSWKIENKIKRGIRKLFHPGIFVGIAEQRVNTAIKWLKKNIKNNFFLMIHCNDLHWPYPVPEPYDHMFDPNYKGEHDFATLCKGKITRGELIFGIKKLPKEEIDHAIAHYDGGLRYTDSQIKRLIDFLKENEVYDNTLVIFTADHGENFGEHDFYFQHGASIYETSLKIPLIFRLPGKIPKNKKIENRVQILDVTPTVLDILDIPVLGKIEGFNLMPLIEGKIQKVRDFLFIESIEEHFPGNKRMYIKGVKGKWRAMIVDDWKIIYIPHPEKDIFELYNIKDDFKENNNLIDKEKEKAEEMKKRILDFLKTQSNEGEPKAENLTEKSKKLLIQAGYLE